MSRWKNLGENDPIGGHAPSGITPLKSRADMTARGIGITLFIVGLLIVLFVGGSFIYILKTISDLFFKTQLAEGIPTWTAVIILIIFIWILKRR